VSKVNIDIWGICERRKYRREMSCVEKIFPDRIERFGIGDEGMRAGRWPAMNEWKEGGRGSELGVAGQAEHKSYSD